MKAVKRKRLTLFSNSDASTGSITTSELVMGGGRNDVVVDPTFASPAAILGPDLRFFPIPVIGIQLVMGEGAICEMLSHGGQVNFDTSHLHAI